MRELPILFSTPMVQAIQAGNKNQTRRTAGLEKVNENPEEYEFLNKFYREDGLSMFQFDHKKTGFVYCKPRYQQFDKIWVKETYFDTRKYKSFPTFEFVNDYVYRADKDANIGCHNWKPSLFMPKVAARLWLECTGVRCERLLDIKNEDCIDEGIEKWIAPDTTWFIYKDYMCDVDWWGQERTSFISLWESVNGRSSYKTNPWVFIYDFKKIQK